MTKTQDKVAASVTVYRVADMTKKGRKEVCGWLRKLADDLQREPESFAKTFRAQYLYSPNARLQVQAIVRRLDVSAETRARSGTVRAISGYATTAGSPRTKSTDTHRTQPRVIGGKERGAAV